MQLIFIAYGNAHDFNRRIAVFEQADGDAHTKIEQIFLGTYTVGAFEQPAEVAAIDIAVCGQALNGQMFVVAIFNFLIALCRCRVLSSGGKPFRRAYC
jgi:hypothetical protein